MSSTKTTSNPLHIKNVIVLLCKHLNLSIGCSFKPEYFRLAKYGEADDDVTNALWTVLHILSRQAVKDIQPEIDFNRYDDHHATKLYFAFLQYSCVEFYALSPKINSSNRELLLAFGWLLANKEVLNIAIRTKLATSILSQEYSCNDESPEKLENPIISNDTKSQMHALLHTCGRINHNIKEIAELVTERIKLTTKIHAASLNASGLPHLSVSQVSLTKNLSINRKPNFSSKDTKYLEELKSLAKVLETHLQWKKCEEIFYDWMVTVIEEKQNDESEAVCCVEISNFLTLLRHVTKKKLHSIKANENTQTSIHEESCCSRLSRTQQENTEIESWSSKTVEQLNILGNDVEMMMNELTEELSKMLRSIPNCVEI